MNIKTYKKIIIYTLVICILVTCGCNSKSSEKPIENKSKPSPPGALLQIEDSIDSIINLLDKEGKIQEKTPVQTQDKKGEDKSQNNNQKKSDENNSEDSNKKSEQASKEAEQTEGAEDQKQQNPWVQADKVIKEIHKKWNEYQPEAVKNGVSRELIDSFETDLNTLTNNIAVKNLMSTLNNANNLYKYIPNFLSYYKDDTVNVKHLKYYTRDVMYKSRFDKWNLALVSIDKAVSIVPNIRYQSNEQTKQIFQSLEFSVNSLNKVTQEKQKSLTQIKGNIVLDNIKDIIKILNKESEDQEEE